MKKLHSAALIAGSLLVLTACGADQQSATQTIETVSSIVDTATTDKMATLSLIDGTPFSLVDTYRAKPVALWFWAPG